ASSTSSSSSRRRKLSRSFRASRCRTGTACRTPLDSRCSLLESLRSHDGSTEVGRVSKQWTNLLQEYFTDVDNFGITFPRDLSVKIKAVVLAACFLIDFMFFEGQNRRSQH
ncbi:hypothetical protein BOX15_Mlig003802g2, partial [Macrostomum lignano]